jgi:hypothetical protein
MPADAPQPDPVPPERAPSAGPLVERLRGVHLEMVDAVLSGDGLERVAELAAAAVGGPVAIVVPRLGASVVAPRDVEPAVPLDAVQRYVSDRLRDRPARVPDGLAAEAPISAGDEVLGSVVLLAAGGLDTRPEAAEFLHLAAVASLTEVAIAEARDEVEQSLRTSVIEDLRSRDELDVAELTRRAARLGCRLERGAVVLCAELTTDRPRHVVATVAGEVPGALAQHL